MILANCWVITMDDAGTEHRSGWVQIDDGLVTATGSGQPPGPGQNLHGAVVTPGFVKDRREHV